MYQSSMKDMLTAELTFFQLSTTVTKTTLTLLTPSDTTEFSLIVYAKKDILNSLMKTSITTGRDVLLLNNAKLKKMPVSSPTKENNNVDATKYPTV